MTNVFTWHRAGTGSSHEMPTIFGWLSEISQMLIHPYFIFDGPDRPLFKGGDNRIYGGGPPLLVHRLQELLGAFGFSWHTVGLSRGLLQMLIGITRHQERQRQSSPTFNHMVSLMSL